MVEYGLKPVKGRKTIFNELDEIFKQSSKNDIIITLLGYIQYKQSWVGNIDDLQGVFPKDTELFVTAIR